MKLSKVQKLFVVIILLIILFFILFIMTLISCLIIRNNRKNQVIEIAEGKGYEIQFENNNFVITQDGVVYYYEFILDKLFLVRIYTELTPVTDHRIIKDNIGKLTITIVGKDKFEVALEDTVIEVNNQGKEMTFDESVGFVCSSEFTEESIDQKDIISIMGKADKYYYMITHCYISSNRLREICEIGKTIAEELNAE